MALFSLTVASAKVAASLSNYPAYVDLSEMPSAFWDVVTNGGGDIRCYSDSAKTTELAREVVSCNTSTDTGELHVKITSLTTTTVIYIDVDGSRSDYAVTDTYGRNNVWSEYSRVYHLEGNATDATGNVNGTVTSVTYSTSNGKIQQGGDFNGSSSKIAVGNPPSPNTVTAWINHDTNTGEDDIYADWGGGDNVLVFHVTSQKLSVFRNSFATGATVTGVTNVATGTWYHAAFTNKGTGASDAVLYLNGTSDKTGKGMTFFSSSLTAYIGSGDRGTSNYWDGKLDEVRVSESSRTDEWITTEYNNQSAPDTFWTIAEVTAGTPSNAFALWYA